MGAVVFSTAGCGMAGSADFQPELEEMSVDLEVQQENPKVRADLDMTQTQEDGQEQNETEDGVLLECSGGKEGSPYRKWTQEEIDEENLQERAAYEEKVKAADGISEEEALEIARKAMEADLGEEAKGLKLHEAETRYGWKAYLWDLTDWPEYKDKGEIGYSIQFDNTDKITELDDIFAYHCMVNAVDGSICGAYSSKGLFGDEDIWYDH